MNSYRVSYQKGQQNCTENMRFSASTFTGKEKDEETGYGYFGARYMDHELMTMWLSVDPMADKYPSISPYAYCAWNPIKLVDPEGGTPIPVLLKELFFVIKYPAIAKKIGFVKKGSSNISTCAVRFATREQILYGSNKDNEIEEGSETGAFRHALWQATITANYGSKIAKEIGDAHEISSTEDLFRRTFDNIEEADRVVDLLNNIIGRRIGNRSSGASMDKIANAVLYEFKKNGLFTVSKDSKGNYVVSKKKLSHEKYEALKEIFSGLNEYGRKPGEQSSHKKDAMNIYE